MCTNFIILSEISQTQKTTSRVVLDAGSSGTDKAAVPPCKSVLAGAGSVTAEGVQETFRVRTMGLCLYTVTQTPNSHMK